MKQSKEETKKRVSFDLVDLDGDVRKIIDYIFRFMEAFLDLVWPLIARYQIGSMRICEPILQIVVKYKRAVRKYFSGK